MSIKSLTHFVSLPLTDESFQIGFSKFKETAVKQNKNLDKFFIQQSRLHLTVGVMSLPEEEDVQKAVRCLEECKDIVNPLLQDNKLQVILKGVGFFKGLNPKFANVLYANAAHSNDPDLLQTLMENIKEKFTEEGLMKKEKKSQLNIHATLMKTTRKTHFKKFDVKNILETYDDHSFGEGVISRIDLSLFRVPSSDYYKSSGTLSLI